MENLLGVVKEVNSGPANSEGRQGCGIVVVGSSRTDPLPVLHCQLTRMPESTFVFTDSEDALEAILCVILGGYGSCWLVMNAWLCQASGLLLGWVPCYPFLL
jgi:hypothetical protein